MSFCSQKCQFLCKRADFALRSIKFYYLRNFLCTKYVKIQKDTLNIQQVTQSKQTLT